MAVLIKELKNNRKVIFDKGSFDNWCVYVVEANGHKQAPFDTTYFDYLQKISIDYPNGKVYDDFIIIYHLTTKNIDAEVLNSIDTIVTTYKPEHQIEVEQWFSVIYAGMVAEENKENAILKKRIKRLGMHQTLIDKWMFEDAANFSKGKGWRELDEIMKEKGF